MRLWMTILNKLEEKEKTNGNDFKPNEKMVQNVKLISNQAIFDLRVLLCDQSLGDDECFDRVERLIRQMQALEIEDINGWSHKNKGLFF